MHEFGHTLGLLHIMRGSFEPMDWGGLAPLYNYCPPHFNPLTKIQFSWIPLTNIMKVNSNTNAISLRPSHLVPSGSEPTVALITVYGQAGKDSVFSHSEYFMIEYRTRSGFNRFTGGSQLSPGASFTGGALIWHYSSVTPYPYNSSRDYDLQKYLSLKIPNYGPDYGGWQQDQEPTDYFVPGGATFDSVNQAPNSSSVIGLKTGITAKNFSFSGGNLNFDINYQLGQPPAYDVIYRSGNTPSTLSGNVFLQKDITINTTVNPGAVLDFVPGCGISLTTKNFSAIGGTGSTDSIIFEGAGYGTYRRWGKSNTVPILSSPVGIWFHPTSFLSGSVQVQNCIIKDAGIGVLLDFTNFSPGIRPDIHGNRFSNNNDIDFVFRGKSSSTSTQIDISGYDNNIMSSFLLYGNATLNTASQFTVPANTLFRFEQVEPSFFTQLYLATTRTFQADGLFRTAGTVKVKNGSFILNAGGTVQAGSTLTIGAATNFTSSDLSIASGANLKVDTGSTVKVFPASTFTVNGKLIANGTSANRITFTSGNANPAPGDWVGIQCSGGGPDTLKYCDIKYAEVGIVLGSTAANSYMEQDSVLFSSVSGVQVSNTQTSSTALKLYKTKIMNNRLRGLKATNAKVAVNYSRIEGNGAENIGPGVEILSGAKVYFDSSRVQGNTGKGISVSGTNSRASLTKDEIARGYNTVTQHGLSEIYLENSGTAFLGNTVTVLDYCDCGGPQRPTPLPPDDMRTISAVGCDPGCTPVYAQVTRGGWNNVNNSYSYSCRLINNTTATSVKAHYTYWGSGSTMFCGSVDSAHQLGGSISTPAKMVIADDAKDPLGIGTSRADMIKWLRQLKSDIEDGAEYSVDAMHQLALYTGPGGGYADALTMPWESFLANVEGTSSLSSKVKETAAALRLQAKMDRGNYDEAITFANELLQRPSINDDVWLYCQTRKIIASAALGKLDDAHAALATARGRAMHIDSNTVRAMEEHLATAPPDGVPGATSSSGEHYSSENYSETPKETALLQNYPNPFNPLTVIRYQLSEQSNVMLKVYDVLGREVATLVNELQDAGSKTISWDASSVPSGVYFYRMQAGAFSDIKKMLLVR